MPVPTRWPPSPAEELLSPALTPAERALAAFLRDDVAEAFARVGRADDAARVDVYLKLNQVLRLDDTPGAVRVQQRVLPRVLREILADLGAATSRDLLHVALRTLSYLLHHAALAATVADAQLEALLSGITGRLTATHDEATYKLCVWCLAMQNVDLARLDFLPRVVEALVLAIINPFGARDIAVQAIKGIHKMAGKFKPRMVSHGATLRIWFRPVVSRLASSDRTTRQQAALVLVEAAVVPALHTEWTSDSVDEVASALTEYAIPAIHAHVTEERHQDAMTVWKAVLVLMRQKLTQDVVLFNELLSIAEAWMRHGDASVRLQGVDVWRHVVGVFRASGPEWVFERHMVMLLVRPILVAIETETAFNVLHAAMATWRVVVAAAVQDFNAFCESQGRSVDAIQQRAKKLKWKRWLDEVVRKVVVAAIEQERAQVDGNGMASHSAVHEVIQSTVRDMFSTAAATVAPTESEPPVHSSTSNLASSSIGSSTTITSSHSEQQARDSFQPGMNVSAHDEQLVDEELLQYSASASLSNPGDATHAIEPACTPLSSLLLSSAIVVPDVLKTVEKLGQAADAVSAPASESQRKYQLLGLSIWDGFCARLARTSASGPADAGTDKMRLRLVRFCLDFPFGISSTAVATSSSVDSQASVLAPSLPTDSAMTAVDLINGARPHTTSTQALWWQLRLLRQVFTLASSDEELLGLFQHPKSKIAQHLLSRVDRIADGNEVYREWLAQWDQQAPTASSRADGARIDFSSKTSVMLCVMLYLLLNLSLVFDAENAQGDTASNERLYELVGIYGEVVSAIHKCVVDSKSLAVAKFCDVVVNSTSAAKAILDRDTHSGSVADAGVGRLLRVCVRLASRSEDTQDNAAVLLQLQRSPVKEASPEPQPARAPAPAFRDAARATGEGDVHSVVSAGSESVISPCLLQAKRSTPSASKMRADPCSPSRSATHRSETARATPPIPQTPPRPKRSALKAAASTPSSTMAMTPTRGAVTSTEVPLTGPIFPDLVNSTEPIAQVYGSFPFAFRQLAPFHKIETVGHLAAMSAEQVKKLGIKDGPVAVRKALVELQARRARSRLPAGINSPFHQRLQSPHAVVRTPAGLPSPSPKRVLKRPTDSPNRLPVTPLPFESPQQRKRARRSLHELSGDTGGATPSEQRVTFRLETESGESRITRPGSDSQDVSSAKEEKEDPQEKLRMVFIKMDQHLSRSLHYAKKIIEEEEALLSLSASLGDENSKLSFLTEAVQASMVTVSDISDRLVMCAQRSLARNGQAQAKAPGTAEQRPS